MRRRWRSDKAHARKGGSSHFCRATSSSAFLASSASFSALGEIHTTDNNPQWRRSGQLHIHMGGGRSCRRVILPARECVCCWVVCVCVCVCVFGGVVTLASFAACSDETAGAGDDRRRPRLRLRLRFVFFRRSRLRLRFRLRCGLRLRLRGLRLRLLIGESQSPLQSCTVLYRSAPIRAVSIYRCNKLRAGHTFRCKAWPSCLPPTSRSG